MMRFLLIGLVVFAATEQLIQPAFAAPATAVAAARQSAVTAANDTASQQTAATTEKVRGAKVSIANFTFTPAEITIVAGETVTWTNDDGAPHGLEYADGAKAPDLMLPGASFSRQFDRPGTYNYNCSVHPYMTGRVIVQ
jgi:plastocyanin